MSSQYPGQRGGTVLPGRVVLPNRVRTPGALNPAVSQATIATTVCRAGWTATIRPHPEYTTALKIRQLASGYTYRGDTKPSDYEEDHLIPLELGGSPTSTRNLWPEPYLGTGGALVKDRIENKLHELVCARVVGLATTQHVIAANWWQAYRRYIEISAPSPPRPIHRQTSAPPPPPVGHACTRTSTGSCIRAGEFCPAADYGQSGRDANGTSLTCTGDHDHPHWT